MIELVKATQVLRKATRSGWKLPILPQIDLPGNSLPSNLGLHQQVVLKTRELGGTRDD
jgi:hypothetical protein